MTLALDRCKVIAEWPLLIRKSWCRVWLGTEWGPCQKPGQSSSLVRPGRSGGPGQLGSAQRRNTTHYSSGQDGNNSATPDWAPVPPRLPGRAAAPSQAVVVVGEPVWSGDITAGEAGWGAGGGSQVRPQAWDLARHQQLNLSSAIKTVCLPAQCPTYHNKTQN